MTDIEDLVTITCPTCGHTETMSEVSNDQLCDDCFDDITRGNAQ